MPAFSGSGSDPPDPLYKNVPDGTMVEIRRGQKSSRGFLILFFTSFLIFLDESIDNRLERVVTLSNGENVRTAVYLRPPFQNHHGQKWLIFGPNGFLTTVIMTFSPFETTVLLIILFRIDRSFGHSQRPGSTRLIVAENSGPGVMATKKNGKNLARDRAPDWNSFL